MRKYGTNDAAGNRVRLNLGAFLDTPMSPKIRQLENYKLDNYVHDYVRNGLSAFVEVHSPEFTGERGTTYTIREVRSLELDDAELVKNCIDILLTHFTDAESLHNTVKFLGKWNDYKQ